MITPEQEAALRAIEKRKPVNNLTLLVSPLRDGIRYSMIVYLRDSDHLHESASSFDSLIAKINHALDVRPRAWTHEEIGRTLGVAA